MVNVANIDKVIRAIKDEYNSFNMSTFFLGDDDPTNFCGTPMCIAGHAASIRYNEEGSEKSLYRIFCSSGFDDYVSDWLGVNSMQGIEMYFNCPMERRGDRDYAIAMLEHLKETGEVVWGG